MARGSGSGSRRADHGLLLLLLITTTATTDHRGRGRRVEDKASSAAVVGVLFDDQLNRRRRRRVIEVREDVLLLALCLFRAHLIVLHGGKARLLVRSLGGALFSV